MAWRKTGSSNAGIDGTGGRRVGGGGGDCWRPRPVCILRGIEDDGVVWGVR